MPSTNGKRDALQLPVLCFARCTEALPWDHDDVPRLLMQSGRHSVLLVPDTSDATYPAHYQRIAVTLDGSSRAERVLPIAIALARKYAAELLVLHAIPEPGLTQTGPLESEALELCRQLTERNRRIAQRYLRGIRTRFESEVNVLSTRLIEGSDVKHRLMDSVISERVDLLLLASHGATGHQDVALGSVAEFLLEHIPVPVMMVGREHSTTLPGALASTEPAPSYRPTVTPG